MFTAAGKSAAVSSAVYVEDVFSTWLYTGNGSTQTITNGIDLSGKGGMVWVKSRNNNNNHAIADTVRGTGKIIIPNLTNGELSNAAYLPSFNSNGFAVQDGGGDVFNASAYTYASWTFREQAKFFDVVTYTGNGVAGRTVAHNLGSVPGCMIIKRTDTTGNWGVYHRSIANTDNLFLNTTGAATSGVNYWNSTTPTSTEFTVGTNANVNASGGTYVAYLFAHDAGGFGAAGTDNVITCGSYTGAAATVTVNLGWEPQWVLIKRATGGTGNWVVLDNMRGIGPLDATNITVANQLFPNLQDAETNAGSSNFGISATGFSVGSGWGGGNAAAGSNYIYIAIRRGLMKTPTSGTSVYENTAYTGNNTAERQIGSTVLLDALLLSNPSANATGWASYAHYVFDRLRGDNVTLSTTFTSGEGGGWSNYIDFDQNIGWDTSNTPSQGYLNNTGSTFVSHTFSRASGFFDVVCYTGTGANRTLNHNLGVVPEMMIVKVRSGTSDNWWVYDAATGNTKYQALNTTAVPVTSSTAWNNTTPTSSVFTVGTGAGVNGSTFLYVAYLFASCPGVSKVGSYTGTGALQTVNCGFASGARFVLIKRTDSTGDWYLYNSASGITSGNDPYVLLNSAAAEVTGTNYVDTASTGFQVTAAAPAGLNANGGTYIFLAIA